MILLDPHGAALVVNGRLEDLVLDPRAEDTTPAPGAVHLARVDRLVPKGGAAFVQLGDERMGYLREAKGLAEGHRLIVQVTSFAEPGKASPVTARVLHKSRTVIHSPHAPGINVSRQIKEPEERARLGAAAEAALPSVSDQPDPGGFILRTAARDVASAEITEMAAHLLRQRRAILDESKAGRIGRMAAMPPPRAMTLALAEWTNPLPDQILMEGAIWDGLFHGNGAAEAVAELAFSQVLANRCVDAGRALPFALQDVWDEVDHLRGPRADLRSGGWLSVEATAALVAIDVNTGGQFGGGDALTANLEAAREIPRQLRLRGLGGIVTIDWAPLPKRDRRRVEDALKTALRFDPVETTLAGWTPLGLLELTRKRERRPLAEMFG
ncbi:MAG: ribonuclease E/G [Pseudomonadota bacterium]